MGPPDPYGPTPLPPQPAYGPEPVQYRPVVLVLGPGMARGFAHAGVIRALREAKIPIGAIVGTEMGSLIGVLYSMNPTINRFEWSLVKVKGDWFVAGSNKLLSAFRSGPSDGQDLEHGLRTILSGKNLKDARVPIRVVFQDESRGAPVAVGEGDAVQAIRAAVSTPGLVASGSWDGKPASSAASSRPYPVSEAKALGIGGVVVVDVLTGARPAPGADSAEQEKLIAEQLIAGEQAGGADLGEADLVIRPDMRGIGYLDFSKRTDAAFRGKKAAIAELPAIRQLVGLPEDGGIQPGVAQ